MLVFGHESLFQWSYISKGVMKLGDNFWKCCRTLFEQWFYLIIWQFVEKSEYFVERLHISKIGFAKILVLSLKNFPERWSIPATLFIFISISNCSKRFTSLKGVILLTTLKHFSTRSKYAILTLEKILWLGKSIFFNSFIQIVLRGMRDPHPLGVTLFTGERKWTRNYFDSSNLWWC